MERGDWADDGGRGGREEEVSRERKQSKDTEEERNYED